MLQSELLVSWTKAVAATGTVIVGSFQFKLTENALEGFGAPARTACRTTAGTRPLRWLTVAVVRVQALLDCDRGQSQRLAPDSVFQRFQVERVHMLASQQGLDIPQDLSGEKAVE